MNQLRTHSNPAQAAGARHHQDRPTPPLLTMAMKIGR